MILLDTHALVWLFVGVDRMGAGTRRLCDALRKEEKVLISAISFWELARLQDRARIQLRDDISQWRREILRLGVREMPVDGEIGIAATRLERLHGNPADRIIVASAIHLGATLVTADHRILDWTGPLQRHDART